ncbi:MAG: anti-sigma factor antagonist [Eubacteriales bacterium]|nr:anti-sigma factor antagonist [Eubacteriales bacterium]
MDEMLMVNGSCLTIFLPGEVDHPVSDAIRRESDRIMERIYIKKIVFDFEKTQFMDSSGIGLIMGRYKALGMRNNVLRAVHVNGRMEKILHLSGVHKYMEISGESENHENRGGE